MKLGEIVAKYSHVRHATALDNDAILEFLSAIPTEAADIAFRFERKPDYFKYLDYQNRRSFVFIFENEDRTIGGVAALGLKTHFIDGRAESVVYMSDVRLCSKLSRVTRVQWRSFYADLVRNVAQIEEFESSRFVYTLVMDGNAPMIRAFTRGKGEIVYETLASYDTVNVVGRNPLVRDRLLSSAKRRGLRARAFEPKDLAPLRAFLHAQNSEKPLGHHFTLEPWTRDGKTEYYDELQRRLISWDGLELSDFIVVENRQGLIIGCVAPWSFDQGRRLIIESLPFGLKLLGRALPLFGRPMAIKGKPLKVLNMTHFELASELDPTLRLETFALLLREAWRILDSKSYHFLSLAEFKSESFKEALAPYVVSKIPASLYEVSCRPEAAKGPEASAPPITRIKLMQSAKTPAFEIAIP